MLQQKNKELDALNQKMLSVMDEKDYQIRVSSRTFPNHVINSIFQRLNALGGGATKKDGNIRTAISAETDKKYQGQAQGQLRSN